MHKVPKKIICICFGILIIALGIFAIQCARFYHTIDVRARSEYGVNPSNQLSAPIESILDGSPQYINLYAACNSLNEQVSKTVFYCTAYARDANRLFFTRTLTNEMQQSIQIPDDLSVCEDSALTFSICLSYLMESALAYESQQKDVYSPKNRAWLESILVQVKQLDQALSKANLPTVLRTKDDVVSYLAFFRDQSDFINQFHEVIQEHPS